MKDLRKLARGKPCMVRIPGVCNHNPDTTVLAHIRRGGVAGVGQKPPDTCGVWACSNCHSVMGDGYAVDGVFTEGDILEALCRQLAWYDKHEVLLVCA